MEDNDKDNNNKDDNDDKGISALELDNDMGFLRGHKGYQGHRPHDDDHQEDDNMEEDDNKEEGKDKDDDNVKDNNNDKGILAQGLDRHLGFLPGHKLYQEYRPHDGDENKEEDNEVEDYDKD